MNSFRLLTAELPPFARMKSDETSSPLPGSERFGAEQITFDGMLSDSESPSLSVVIGRNGSGKSRLLGSLARAFQFIERGFQPAREFPFASLSYRMDGRTFLLRKSGSEVRATADGQVIQLSDVAIPRTIALTLTPFDKFPVPSLRADRDVDVPPTSYTYFGIRDQTNRASITALLYRSLEKLFEVSRGNLKRRQEVVRVFDFLGYRPRVKVVYVVRLSLNILLDILTSPSSMRESEWREHPDFVRMQEALDTGKIPEADLKSALSVVSAFLERKEDLSLTLDFVSLEQPEEVLHSVHVLRRARLLGLRAVEVERSDGARFNLKQASSGELSIVTAFLSLATTIDDASLILIDEPELSLHPAWQSRYVDLMLSTFRRYMGCHYVVATHSPLILADISEATSTVINLDGDNDVSPKLLAGQSADFLLVNAFHAPGPNNYYLKQELIRALRLVADGKIYTEEFKNLVVSLTSVADRLDRQDPVRSMVAELKLAASSQQKDSE